MNMPLHKFRAQAFIAVFIVSSLHLWVQNRGSEAVGEFGGKKFNNESARVSNH